jgi:hypothetical protein
MTTAVYRCWAIAAVLVSALSHAACDAPRAKIAEASSLGEARPLIAWEPVSGATRYRVKVLSRVPNGRVLVAHDAVVSAPAFLPPQPLAEQRAKVQLRVAAICGAETSAETVTSFDIDATANCRLAQLDVRRDARGAELRWTPVMGALSYEVRALALMDGKLIATRETRTPGARLELPGEGAVVSVQPRCTAASGDALYRVLAAD